MQLSWVATAGHRRGICRRRRRVRRRGRRCTAPRQPQATVTPPRLSTCTVEAPRVLPLPFPAHRCPSKYSSWVAILTSDQGAITVSERHGKSCSARQTPSIYTKANRPFPAHRCCRHHVDEAMIATIAASFMTYPQVYMVMKDCVCEDFPVTTSCEDSPVNTSSEDFNMIYD